MREALRRLHSRPHPGPLTPPLLRFNLRQIFSLYKHQNPPRHPTKRAYVEPKRGRVKPPCPQHSAEDQRQREHPGSAQEQGLTAAKPPDTTAKPGEHRAKATENSLEHAAEAPDAASRLRRCLPTVTSVELSLVPATTRVIVIQTQHLQGAQV